MLLTTGDVDGERIRYLLGLLELPVRTRFFVMADTVVIEESTGLYRPCR